MWQDQDQPFLITLGMDEATFTRLDDLRRRYFPPERNQIPAHVSLFHHLPGNEFDAIDAELARVAKANAPITLRFKSPRPTGRGVMLVVDAPRDLTPQDKQPYHPHVMVMNKAERHEADAALAEIQASWAPWSGTGDRLILWRYLGGPWDEVASYSLTGAPAPPRR